jgi:hypothetical protein
MVLRMEEVVQIVELNTITQGVGKRAASAMMMDIMKLGLGSGRQGCNLAGESPVVSIARVGHVVMPQFMEGNPMSIAWCKRPGRPENFEFQRWVQPGGLASMGA